MLTVQGSNGVYQFDRVIEVAAQRSLFCLGDSNLGDLTIGMQESVGHVDNVGADWRYSTSARQGNGMKAEPGHCFSNEHVGRHQDRLGSDLDPCGRNTVWRHGCEVSRHSGIY